MGREKRPTWALVADRGAARIFAAHAADWADLHLVQEFAHPESRVRMHETVSDGPARITGRGPRHAAVVPHTDYAHATAEVFARELLARLEAGLHAGEFGELVVAAPPLFLGVLRAGMSLALQRATSAEHHLDLTAFDLRAVRERLAPAAAP